MTDATLLSLTFLEYQPKAAASILEEFPPEKIIEFLEQAELSVLVPVINYMASWPAARLLSILPEQLAADILRKLPATDAETLLRLMLDDQRNTILKHMPHDVAKNYTHKLIYPVSTVGAWMDTTVPSFTTDSSVDHCLDLVKRQKSHLGGVVIVVDNKKILVGLVEVEMLLTSDGDQKLSELLDTDIEPLPAKATLWEVEQHEGWTRFPALPVTDHNQIMLGALTHGALRAGTAKSTQKHGRLQTFPLAAEMGKSFLVTLNGLLHVIAGTPHTAQRPARATYSETRESETRESDTREDHR